MDELPLISVLGCGWFGLPMAKALVNNGYTINGSTTSPEKITSISSIGAVPFLVQISQAGRSVPPKFLVCDVLLINVPPKSDTVNYAANIKAVVELAIAANVKQLIFISSTSVYGDENSVITENTYPEPETESGKAIRQAEKLLLANPNITTTIVRFAGLVGPARNPGKFLAGRQDVANGEAPVNLLHLEDCIGVVTTIIAKKAYGHIFNACSPDHLSRAEFYTLAAEAIGLPPPQFINEKRSWKIIDSVNVPRFLQYTYRIADWREWLGCIEN